MRTLYRYTKIDVKIKNVQYQFSVIYFFDNGYEPLRKSTVQTIINDLYSAFFVIR